MAYGMYDEPDPPIVTKVFVLLHLDRHTDPQITIHRTMGSVNRKIDEIRDMYRKYSGGVQLTWTERPETAKRAGWARYLDTGADGPAIRVSEHEVLP